MHVCVFMYSYIRTCMYAYVATFENYESLLSVLKKSEVTNFHMVTENNTK